MPSRDQSAKEIIRHLRLAPHPEGGFFRETYRSEEVLAANYLPKRFKGARAFSTAIYYLLESGDFSALHRIQSDELWHFYSGAPLDIVMLSAKGFFSKVRLGLDFDKGEQPQIAVPRGVWFGAAPASSKRKAYSFVGCTVAPGFDFSDFEMADCAQLLKKFPARRGVILKWTRQSRKAKVSS